MNRQNNSFSDISSVSSSMTSIFETRLDRWNAADLEFFDSAYEEKIIATAKSVQHANKNTYFRDVHLFIDRAKDIALVKDYDAVKNNLYICFREQVMIWYTTEMTNEEKELIKIDNNLNVWERYLIKRFRERSNVTMIIITKEKYIMNDARRRRESREYVNVIIRVARSAKLESESHQILMIYNDLDLKFQRDISMSELFTKIQNFLQCLNDKKNIWWDLVNRNRNSYSIYIKFYSEQFRAYYQSEQQSFDQYDIQNANQRIDQWNFTNLYRSQSSNQYEANQDNQSQSQIQNAKQLNASKSLLQITVDSSSEFASFKSNLFRSSDNIIFRSNQSEQNQKNYERSNRFFEKAWNQENAWNNQKRDNIYNQNRAQEAYTDAIEKNQKDVDISSNNQDAESRTNEIDKKNQNFYELEDDHHVEEYSYFFNEDEYHIDTEVVNQKKSKTHQCRKCKTKLISNNKLHRHLRECRKTSKKQFFTIETFHLIESTVSRIITSIAKSDLFKDLAFRTWHFVIFLARIFRDESLNELCANTRCIMSLIDKAYLTKILFESKIHRIEGSVIVRDIDIATHNCSEYVHLKLFISEFKKTTRLIRQAHVVNNLRAKFLMKMNILESEKIVLNLSRRKMILTLCENVEINIRITSIAVNIKSVNRVILTKQLVSVSTKFIVSVSIRMKRILSDRDFLFQSIHRELSLEFIDEVMTHIVTINLAAMQMCNVTNKSVIILRKARLERLMKYEKHECYSIDIQKTLLVAEFFWHKIFALAEIRTSMKNKSRTMKKTSVRRITIYENSNDQQLLLDVIEKYSDFWDKIENFVVNVSEKEWMFITLKSDVKIEFAKIYSMRSKNQKLIDEIFDKLHEQDKMHWTTESTAHEVLVFVIWRMINEEKKNRVVVNIRNLNKIVESDSYSMSLQSNIIATVSEAKFISVIDAVVFFYQFRIQIFDRHKLTIISHREQEYFSMTLMSFKNSSTYAQRRIDIILRDLKHCCRAFIDDITIFFSTLDDHVMHLNLVLQRLFSMSIKLNSFKTFLSFSSMTLLDQHVDEFELHAVKNKIVVILNWKFSATLKALKIYLEFIEWLRNYVAWYAQKAKSLQQRKTLLLRNSSSQKDFVRKTYFSKTTFEFIDREFKSFELIQEAFKNSRFFTHFNLIRQFLIDVNASKNDFEVFAYHLKREDIAKSTAIESIVFLSKILISAKKRYWSTELKIAVVVWVVK
jgi:hypothetical protein